VICFRVGRIKKGNCLHRSDLCRFGHPNRSCGEVEKN